MIHDIIFYVTHFPFFIYILQFVKWIYTQIYYIKSLLIIPEGKIHKYPRRLKLCFVGFNHKSWVENDHHYICNLPSTINENQYIIDLHADEKLSPIVEGDRVLWEKFFEEVSSCNFYDDLD